MVRIGDGEANLLRFVLHHNEFELKWVNTVFSCHDNQALPIEDSKRLSRELSELLAGAGIIGFRAFGPNPSDVQIQKISEAIDRKDLRGALGMIEALQYGDRAVKNAEFRNTVLTSAWVHLGLFEHLDDTIRVKVKSKKAIFLRQFALTHHNRFLIARALGQPHCHHHNPLHRQVRPFHSDVPQ
jgi:hypothetical protein